MIKANKIYFICLTVFLASLIIAISFPAESVLREIGRLPGIAALFVAIFQLVRDNAAFEKQRTLQENQQYFQLGTTSHMANVAFDKHVAFSEEYIAEVNKTIHTLFREGPTREALAHASRLYGIQQKYIAWLTPDIVLSLEKFEAALRRIGANEGYLHATGKIEKVEEMYDLFYDVMGIAKEEGKPVNKEVAVSSIVNSFQKLLGIEELTQLRRKLLEHVNYTGNV